MKNKIATVKGTREFYPEEMTLRNYLSEDVRAASQAFGYQEWDGPFIETIELYAAKSGEELVKKQSFVFQDWGGDFVTLPPELTPSLARMIAARQGELVYPVRWWSFGPFWRYEQPQKGRTREFFQWNADIIGVASPEVDAELIAVAATFLRKVGLDPQRAQIYINNRRLMEAEFDALGILPEKRLDVSNLIDRRSKMEPAKWDEYALEMGLTEKQRDGLKDVLANYDLWKKSEELTGDSKAIAWACFLIVVTFVAVRFNFLIPDLSVYKLEGLETTFFHRRLRTDYASSMVEWLVSVWIISFGVLIYMAGMRWLPVASSNDEGGKEHA